MRGRVDKLGGVRAGGRDPTGPPASIAAARPRCPLALGSIIPELESRPACSLRAWPGTAPLDLHGGASRGYRRARLRGVEGRPVRGGARGRERARELRCAWCEVEFELLDDGNEGVEATLSRPGEGHPAMERVREAAPQRRWSAVDEAGLFFRMELPGRRGVGHRARGPRADGMGHTGNGELFQSWAGAKRKGARSARPRRTSGQTSSSSPNWPRASAASRSKCGVRPEACDHLVAGGVCPARACPSFSRSCCRPRGSWARRSGGCGRKRRSRRRARDFVSGVSHQHRTPPAQIRMFGETSRPGRVGNEEKRATPVRDRRDEARRLDAPGRQLLTFSQGATRLDAPAPGRDRPRRVRRRSRRPEFAGARRRHPLILKGVSRAPVRTRRLRSWIWYGARPAMPRSR